MPGEVLKRLKIQLLLDSKSYTKALDQATASFAKAGKKMRDLGSDMNRRVTLPILAVAGAMTKLASDAEEQASKLNAIFGKQSAAIRSWAEQYGEATNRGREATKSFAADAGAVLQGLGASGEELTKLSALVTTLSADLSSFNNVSQEQAFGAIRGALTGEREALKSLGIVINEANVKQELLAMGFKGSTQEASAQQKAVATLNLIMKNAGAAMGDAAKTAGGFANSARGVKERLKDVSVELGQKLLPVGLRIISFLNDAISRFNALSDGAKTTILLVGALVAGIGPALTVMGSLATAISGVSAALSTVAGVIGATTLPVLAGVALGTGAVLAAWLYWDEITRTVSGAIETLTGWLKKAAGFFTDLKDKAVDAANTLVSKVVDKFLELQGKLSQVGAKIVVAFPLLFDDDTIADAQANLKKNLDQLKQEAADFNRGVADNIGQGVQQGLDNLKASFGGVASDLQDGASIIGDGVKAGLDSANAALDDFSSRFKKKTSGLLDSIKGLIPSLPKGTGVPTPATVPALPGGNGPLTLPPNVLPGAGQVKSFTELLKDAQPTVEDFSRRAVSGLEDVGDAFADAIIEGESFGDAMKGLLRDLAKDFASMGIRKALLGTVGGLLGSFNGTGFAAGFAGAFAGGGSIPSGQFGLVGERGPELISGPANITSLSESMALNVNIVNNAPAEVSVNRNSQGDLEVLVESMVNKKIAQGSTGTLMQNSFKGVTRNTRRTGI